MAQPVQLASLVGWTIPDQHNFLPIHYAAYRDDTADIRRLTSQGVDKHCLDRDGQTALHVAAKHGSMNVISHLINIEQANVNARNEFTETALHCAAYAGQLAACKSLVKNGADVNASDAGISTVLHHACDAGHLTIVKYLVEQGVVTTITDEEGETALDVARWRNHDDIVAWLT
jgi:ankyrin repeat protein